MPKAKRSRKIIARPIISRRHRKPGIHMQTVEYYSPDDIKAIKEGEDAIKRGDTISLEEFCRREGL